MRGHSKAASLDNPDVHINFDNSKTFFLESKISAEDASIGFSITILPSKERVMYAWMRRLGRDIDTEFAGLVQNELALVQAYATFFDAHNITYSDALPDVVNAFERVLKTGGDFYPLGNGHPFQDGYNAYAEAAIRGLARSQERLHVTIER